MSHNRQVSPLTGFKYHGGNPMWAWMLHRITGLGMVVFISLHIGASFFMQQTSGQLATTINALYESWILQVFVVFFVIYHALNGLRLAILDLWPQYMVYQKQALWVQLFIFAPIYGLTALIIIQHAIVGS
jgi:succinate dehydrogenase / fumarate reductase cytochrome b subunit